MLAGASFTAARLAALALAICSRSAFDDFGPLGAEEPSSTVSLVKAVDTVDALESFRSLSELAVFMVAEDCVDVADPLRGRRGLWANLLVEGLRLGSEDFFDNPGIVDFGLMERATGVMASGFEKVSSRSSGLGVRRPAAAGIGGFDDALFALAAPRKESGFMSPEAAPK